MSKAQGFGAHQAVADAIPELIERPDHRDAQIAAYERVARNG